MVLKALVIEDSEPRSSPTARTAVDGFVSLMAALVASRSVGLRLVMMMALAPACANA